MRINQHGTELMLFLNLKFDSIYGNERKQMNKMNEITFLDAF